jgi:hypothetical protein
MCRKRKLTAKKFPKRFLEEDFLENRLTAFLAGCEDF